MRLPHGRAWSVKGVPILVDAKVLHMAVSGRGGIICVWEKAGDGQHCPGTVRTKTLHSHSLNGLANGGMLFLSLSTGLPFLPAFGPASWPVVVVAAVAAVGVLNLFGVSGECVQRLFICSGRAPQARGGRSAKRPRGPKKIKSCPKVLSRDERHVTCSSSNGER